MKPVVSFSNEKPKDSERILKDIKKILACDKASGKIGTYWYGLKPTDKEDVYNLTVETIKKNKGVIKRHFRNFTIQVKILNRVWVKNDRGILVSRILTNVSH